MAMGMGGWVQARGQTVSEWQRKRDRDTCLHVARIARRHRSDKHLKKHFIRISTRHTGNSISTQIAYGQRR